MRTFVKDLRHGVRLLLKAPSFSTVVVLTLTLAIGANTLIFSIASFLLIRPLPFQDPDTIAFIYAVDPQRGTDRSAASYPDFVDWRDQSTSFERLAALTDTSYTLTGPADPMRVSGRRVSAGLFEAWGFRGDRRPYVSAGGGRLERRARGHAQPRVLGAGVRRVARDDWHDDRARRRGAHDRRRVGPGRRSRPDEPYRRLPHCGSPEQ